MLWRSIARVGWDNLYNRYVALGPISPLTRPVRARDEQRTTNGRAATREGTTRMDGWMADQDGGGPGRSRKDQEGPGKSNKKERKKERKKEISTGTGTVK